MTEERRKAIHHRAISWIDRRHFISVRTAVVGVTVWMTWEVTRWSFKYAYDSQLPGVETAAVIAAVTAPFCALQAAAFGTYMKSKDGNP